ncbi:hypothetical protein BG015_001911 [Linnemannia schmuckeri]|uniref:Uncharacterized protein n=1 Tax=Linnemannia schmuckeri TaxID=64567 RepID=A0A9P5RSL1_9FUNG|nr:hypothetical protein BG015_001911 [Linnemannia schmuckeri]
MPPHQQFRYGTTIESLAVQKDGVTGKFYSRLIDIQETFPGASRFKVDGVIINFLVDENEQRYEPKRIGHYPDEIIDILDTSPIPVALAPPLPPLRSVNSSALTRLPKQKEELGVGSTMDLSVSTLSLNTNTSSLFDNLVRHPTDASQSFVTAATIKPSFLFLHNNISLAHPAVMLSSVASEITSLQHQLNQSTDIQSQNHIHLMQQLFQMVQRQNEMLQELSASRAREEQMLIQQQATLLLQQQSIDRLVVIQERVEAMLVQNYELHEYPIPRLFVVLPDSFKDWDPRNFMMERFRLYFLCECGDNCTSNSNHNAPSGQLTIAAAASTSPITVKNSIHLAKHEGYELSRPTEFFDRYGPYVLGMLRIFRHCLAVATIAAPSVALADNSVREIMDGVKSLSESTMAAVNASIGFLEQKLDDHTISDDPEGAASTDREDDTMFQNLAALEGADLRRLDTFLRNNDKDKILGNLYRITTEQGHVKWVCLEHYQERYRATALASFVQSVETAGGNYNPHLSQITVSLKSSTTLKDFFRRLVSQAPAIEMLDVTLDWDFGSSDLALLVDMLAKSNVMSFSLDLKDNNTSNATIASLRPGKGRYHSLLGLLHNKTLRRLHFSNLCLLGPRTSSLPSNKSFSSLQSFHFHGQVIEGDLSRLTNILLLCPELIDLRLTGDLRMNSEHVVNPMDTGLHHAIYSLKKLQRLHVVNWDLPSTSAYGGYRAWSDPVSLKELVCTTWGLDQAFVENSIRRSHVDLEVLVILDLSVAGGRVDLTPLAANSEDALSSLGVERRVSDPQIDEIYFSKLTHLDLQAPLTPSSLKYLSSIMPRLNLVHFGCNQQTLSLLDVCNFITLKSLSITYARIAKLGKLRDVVLDPSKGCQIQSLRICGLNDYDYGFVDIVKILPLQRLHLLYIGSSTLVAMLGALNLSQLQVVSIQGASYCGAAEASLASRSQEFTDSLIVQLDSHSQRLYERYGGVSLPCGRYDPLIMLRQMMHKGFGTLAKPVSKSHRIKGFTHPLRELVFSNDFKEEWIDSLAFPSILTTLKMDKYREFQIDITRIFVICPLLESLDLYSYYNVTILDPYTDRDKEALPDRLPLRSLVLTNLLAPQSWLENPLTVMPDLDTLKLLEHNKCNTEVVPKYWDCERFRKHLQALSLLRKQFFYAEY